MSKLIFISHPEVNIDPERPITRWHLTDSGIHQIRNFSESPVVSQVTSVWSSGETKSIEAAGILAAVRSLSVIVDKGLGENDRTSTGYLPREEFEETADAFFADPSEGPRGWESAQTAQLRMIQTLSQILERVKTIAGDVAIVGHGATGTLLYCQLARLPISRDHDQPGPGHFWVFDFLEGRMLHGWQPLMP